MSVSIGPGLRPGHGAGGRPAGSPAAPDGLIAALRAIGADERVRGAEDVLREASAKLRWHEALRRRWREARAESAIRGAAASGAIEGAVFPVSQLRRAVAAAALTQANTADPALDAVAGLWRAQVRLNGWMPDLRGEARPLLPSPRALLSSLHRDLSGPLATAGTVPMEAVGAPRGRAAPLEGGPGPALSGEELTARLDGILALIGASSAPALVRAAVVHAELAVTRPFALGNAALGRLAVRHLITRDGLEPTGTAVVDQYPARAPGAYAQALAAYASGSADGVVAWVVWQAEAILMGMTEATALCRSIQAGSLPSPSATAPGDA